MPEKIKTRDARIDEIDSVSTLLEESYREYASLVPAEAWESYRQDILDVRGRLRDSELIVAEFDGRLVGAVTLYLHGSPSLSWPEGWAGIRLLGVLPGYRRKGVGAALMDECVRRCRNAGLTTIGLHTTTAMAGARRIYERMGFVRVPQYDFAPDDGDEAVVLAYRLDI